MKKNKVKLILSIVFSIIAIIAFLYCLYLLGWFIYEINKIPPECNQNVCVNVEGEPIILILYIISMLFIGVIDILAIVFSLFARKISGFAKNLLICNVSMLTIEIIILITMAIMI